MINEDYLKSRGATFHKINRGGDITYHGPGQIVGYPILDLDNFFTDIHKYLRFLEEAIILTLKEYGLESERSPGETGVWFDVGTPKARKICALGVKSSRWVTMHGFAFNINSDLLQIGPPIRDMIKEIFPETSSSKVDEIINIFRRHYDSKGWRGFSIYPNVKEVLETLKVFL